MATTIAIANQKGGVGKTTTAYNLAAALAGKGKRVLLADLDPQGNLSEYCGFTDTDAMSMADLIQDVVLTATLYREKIENTIRYCKEIQVDYLPATLELASAEIAMQNALSRESILKRILDSVKQDYDYILLDCLPSLGVLLLNALTAADALLIPVQVQKFAVSGLTALQDVMRQVRATVNMDLSLAGILPTMVTNTNVSRNNLATLIAHYGNAVFTTCIHHSVSAARSVEEQTAIPTNTKLGTEYVQLAEELLQRGF